MDQAANLTVHEKELIRVALVQARINQSDSVNQARLNIRQQVRRTNQ